MGNIVRTSVACLALAAGFAGLARSPGSELSLLEELQVNWDHLRYRRSAMRGAPATPPPMRTTCARSVGRRMVRTVHRDKPAPELRCYAALILPTIEIALNRWW